MTSAKQSSSLTRFRTLLWIELAILSVIAVLALVRLTLGLLSNAIEADTALLAYRTGTLAALAVFQVLYMLPLHTFKVVSWKPYLIGNAAMLASLALWLLLGVDEFADLHGRGFYAPLGAAVILAMLHGGVQVIGTNAGLNVREQVRAPARRTAVELPRR